MNHNGILSWDVAALANALKLTVDEIQEYFTDGRRAAFIIERRISREVVHGRLAPSEGAAFDLLDDSGGKWEVRSISRGGIYFCPSYMVGSGRSFEEHGFLRKIEEIEGYIVSDIESFPSVPYWIIKKETVKSWWESGDLGTNSKVSRDKALRLIRNLP
jgi:hypothetical protein